MAEEGKLSFGRNIIFWILWLITTGIAATVRFKIDRLENFQAAYDSKKGGLVLPWHGYTILPIYYFRHKGMYSIVSVSKDGELQNKLLQSRGFKTIRGSSGRHGARALLESIRALKGGGLMAITPDGPRGPAKVVQPGPVHLAKRSGCPVVGVGVACKPCKRLSSWDEHLVPMPFSKAVISFSDPIYIDNDEDDEVACKRIGDIINSAEKRAESLL